MTKKILITGANGFLGYHLVSELSRRSKLNDEEYKIHTFDTGWGNLADTYVLDRYCRNNKIHEPFDYIFHCAISSDVVENTLIDFNVIKWWMSRHPQAQLITFGTDACYQEHLSSHGKIYNLHTEDKYLIGEPHGEWYSYALQKRLLYSILLGLPTDYKWHHFVLTSLFGENWKIDNNHLVHSLVKKCIKAKNEKKQLELIGDGTQLKEIVFVEDATKNIIEIVFNNKAVNDIVNLGSLMKWDTVYNIARLICRYLDYEHEIIRGDPKDNGTQVKYLNTSKALKLVDHYYDSSFSTVKLAVDYYLKIEELKTEYFK